MTAKRILRRIHLVATAWFILCIGYLLATALRQAGLQWWLVCSLSGYSTLMVLLLVSLYLFAFVRGVNRGGHAEIEHPLTSSDCYLGFYVSAPLLGGLVAIMGASGPWESDRFLLSVAIGTLGTTFFMWIVLDPLISLVEMLLPASRRCRAERRHIITACLGGPK